MTTIVALGCFVIGFTAGLVHCRAELRRAFRALVTARRIRDAARVREEELLEHVQACDIGATNRFYLRLRQHGIGR